MTHLKIGMVELDGIKNVQTDIDNTSEYKWRIIIDYINARLSTLQYREKETCMTDFKVIMESFQKGMNK